MPCPADLKPKTVVAETLGQRRAKPVGSTVVAAGIEDKLHTFEQK